MVAAIIFFSYISWPKANLSNEKGVMKARGKLILFADGDGASKFSDFERLENTIIKNSSSLDV